MIHRVSRNRSVLTVFTLGLLAASCGSELLGDKDSKKKSGDDRKTTDIQIGVRQDSSGFSLAAPTTSDFIIPITACSSGYTTTVTSTTGAPLASVPLYTGDGGCVAGLQQFTWETKVYTKSGGGTLTTGASMFQEVGGDELYVQVGTSLAATIAPGSQAIFLISEVKAGSDFAISGYSTSAGLSVSAIEAPELEIPATGISLASIHATTGVATFSVNVQCANILSPDATTCQTPGAENQLFSAMSAKIVTDTYGGVLDYTDANTIMSSGTTAVTAPALSTSAPITKEGFVLSLVGGGQLYSNKDMLLVIQFTDPVSSAKSFRYFNVDIGDPQ
jgi:hypothetical protein